MNQKIAPQEDKPELKEHLAKSGIKMPEKKSSRRRGDSRLGQMDGNVQVGGVSNPNSGSSYNGIFGS